MSRSLLPSSRRAVALALLAGAGVAVAQPAKPSNGVLAGASGMTLYTFDRDTAGSGQSACNGPCATLWPPLMAQATDQASGAWSVVTREDGSKQWAYKGKPLYYYSKDGKAGDKTGDGFRDVWHAAKE